ncbi:hypothetical protein MCOR25_003138 [Pyricularia grisea]|uniref:Uncharacterized protein n=1 Tax=Pyricularia grisea TaxID=148305 RepID=A0A6P8B1B5_PYRGI|nr:uncharacterized protein PgNI_07067 [Pyricularia grisea]KAI6374675.1 hypothetical protein MCOR25_003138 [Pyricularia grisea]TLD08624.1 hypothetical protein PgNI_07067 [Pyricularia grisea]
MAPSTATATSWATAAGGSLLTRRGGGKYEQPFATKPISVVIALTSCCILACFTMVLAIYFMSFSFVFGSSILQFGFGSELNYATCSTTTFLCLGAYVATKVFIYLFLVDRVHIVRDSSKARLRSKLYLLNSFGMMGIYIIIVILNFIFRITDYDRGMCIIGMKQPVIIPLIAFDAVVNVYLTLLFLIPLLKLYSVKLTFAKPLTLQLNSLSMPNTAPNIRLQKLAMRTFIGSCCTLASSVTNLTFLMVLNGEVSWLCLMCCNSDILFSAIIIQWVTANDHAASRKVEKRPRPRADPTSFVTGFSDETAVAFLGRVQAKLPHLEDGRYTRSEIARSDVVRPDEGKRRNSIS